MGLGSQPGQRWGQKGSGNTLFPCGVVSHPDPGYGVKDCTPHSCTGSQALTQTFPCHSLPVIPFMWHWSVQESQPRAVGPSPGFRPPDWSGQPGSWETLVYATMHPWWEPRNGGKYPGLFVSFSVFPASEEQ